MANYTENLIIATAVNLFGLHNELLIRAYIIAHSNDIQLETWRQRYEVLSEESQRNGYSRVIEYCEDQRFTELIRIYKRKYDEREMIIRGQFDCKKARKDKTILESLEFIRKCKTEEESIRRIEMKCAQKLPPTENIELTSWIPTSSMTRSNEISSSQEIYRESIATPPNSKHNKRYYLKMNEEDRELDDYLDQIDESQIHSKEKVLHSVPALVSTYPPLHHQNKSSHDGLPSNTSSSLRETYDSIILKTRKERKTDREKSAWVSEYKSILAFFIEEFDEPSDITAKFQALIDHGNFETIGLVNLTLEVMKILQELIFWGESKAAGFKEAIYYFYDYYRK
ncbi:hypothetical protein TCON_0457 [Astathelohania contejeani]|uniref:Uncharacterized protein n=1 Tax=Astathelohania contejeani TaxID=164912 RepID=A0ABQ7I1K5_9MICR|nr:hypothetical protein TCON_0457 [Thelohania contejeani]